MRIQEKKNLAIVTVIKGHIQKNIKEYLVIATIFLIGIILGVIVINNINIEGQGKVGEYIGNFINSLKGDYQIDQGMLLKNAIVSNLIYAFILWFIGSTVVGMPLVYLEIGIKGFSLGYSISAVIATIRNRKRNFICNNNNVVTKYIMDTSNTCYSSKWNEIT